MCVCVCVVSDNASLCVNDTCRGSNGTVLCLRGTINVNNSCVRK